MHHLKNDISTNPQVQNVGATLYYPGIVNPSDMVYTRKEKQ